MASLGAPPAGRSGTSPSSSRSASSWTGGGASFQVSESCLRARTAADVVGPSVTAEYDLRSTAGGGTTLRLPLVLATVASQGCKTPACAAVSSRLALVEDELFHLKMERSEDKKSVQRTLMRQLLTTAEKNLLAASSVRLSLRILTSLQIGSFVDAREWLAEESNADCRFHAAIVESLAAAEIAARDLAPDPVRHRVTLAGNAAAHPDVSALIHTYEFESIPAAAYPAPIIQGSSIVGSASVEDAEAVVRLFRRSMELLVAKASGRVSVPGSGPG